MVHRLVRISAIVLSLVLALLAPVPVWAQGRPPIGQSGAVAQDVEAGRLYLAQPVSDSVFVLASRTMDLLAVLTVPSSPSALAVDARRHLLYVASDGAGLISVFDDRSYRVARHYVIGGHPAGLFLAPGGKSLLVTDDVDGSVRDLALMGHVQPAVQLFTVGPSVAPTVLIAPRAAPPGGEALAWGRGFTPHETVTLSWGVRPLESAVANAAGIATVRFRTPRRTDLGAHLVILQGGWSSKSESALLTIVPAPPAPWVHTRRRAPSRHARVPSLLQQALTPSVFVPVVLPGSAKAGARGARGARGRAGAGLHIPIAFLTVVLLPIAFLLHRMARARARRAGGRAGRGDRIGTVSIRKGRRQAAGAGPMGRAAAFDRGRRSKKRRDRR